MSEERGPKFGEPFPALPMSDFHAINAATINHAPTTNDDLMRLIQLRPSWETLAPSSVTPHLLRRILSDDTVIQALQEKLTETEADRDQARAELETLRAEHPDEWGVALTEGDTSVSSAGRHENVARHAVELDPAGRKLMYRRGPSQWREIPASAIPPVEQETVYDASGAFVMHRPRLGAAGRKAEGGGDDA